MSYYNIHISKISVAGAFRLGAAFHAVLALALQVPLMILGMLTGSNGLAALPYAFLSGQQNALVMFCGYWVVWVAGNAVVGGIIWAAIALCFNVTTHFLGRGLPIRMVRPRGYRDEP